jgi:hypothetical protein
LTVNGGSFGQHVEVMVNEVMVGPIGDERQRKKKSPLMSVLSGVVSTGGG